MESSRRTVRRPLRVAGVLTALALTAAPLAFSGSAADAGGPAKTVKPTIVLVHGAWADSSGWADVVEDLRKDGYGSVTVANPLRGLASDAAYLDTTLAGIDGPIILVGHSYAGEVITETAPNPQVKALVYVGAFIPDEGENTFTNAGRFPGSKITPDAIRTVPLPSGDADVYIKPELFGQIFGVPAKTARLFAVTQRPVTYGALTENAAADPAWERLPSWALITEKDQAIPLAAQRFMTKRAGSHTVEVNAPHGVFATHPGAVTAVIEQAATAR